MNAVEIEEAISALAEQPFVPAEFPYSFLEAFGNKETTIKRLKSGNNNKSDIEGGVLQQNNIHISVCDEGKVSETLKSLKESRASAKGKVKFVLATDGKEFQAEDIFSGETVACEYPAFHNYFGFFLPLAGISTVKQIRENAFDIKATSRLNKLYMELLRSNPEWSTAERRHDMNHFLARLIFCFFAEDTGIFRTESLFTETVQRMSSSDSSDTHEVISEIFRAMDTKEDDRVHRSIKNWASDFPYVNGHLFSGSTETPKFTKIARSYLLHVGSLDWKKINPDIFGSMIQAVADEDERGSLGMHYTSVPNILKVLNPLLLDELRLELKEAGDNSRKLLNLRKRISRIRVFDPACGSGNFLVIAYKELREIESEINKRRAEADRLTDIPLTNFRGIEIRDFSAEVARLALIIAEYQCNVLYQGQKLALAEFLPLNSENWITRGNALRINWLAICPPTGTGVKLFEEDLFSTPLDQAEIDFVNEGGETYICGNPPYKGSSEQTNEMKLDMKELLEGHMKDYKSLDYVAGWFFKAALYGLRTKARSAFVTTNSICQGLHVPALWPTIFKKDFRIYFAHTSFRWKNLAAKNAGVYVIIVGLTNSPHDVACRLFSENNDATISEKKCSYIGPYLVPEISVIIQKQSHPISDGLSEMEYGSKAADGKNLNFDAAEARIIIQQDLKSQKFIFPYVSADDAISGNKRYCLWIEEKDVAEASNISVIRQRSEMVKNFRLKSSKQSTRALAERPYQFAEPRFVRDKQVVVIPSVSSESRRFLPFSLLPKNTVITNAAFGFYDVPLWNTALLASTLHLIWISTVCGKLKTDYRYSNTLGWNTFPVPQLTEKNKSDLTYCAKEILLARERHFPSTIAELYDPDNMPEDLLLAHERNNEVLERIYIGRRFKNDTERLEKLFELYTKMTSKVKAA
jgi:hypothetical protein